MWSQDGTTLGGKWWDNIHGLSRKCAIYVKMCLIFIFLLDDLQDTADFEWMMWFSTFREHILFALSGHVLFAKICSMLAPQVLLLTDSLITWLSCCRERNVVKDVKGSGLMIRAKRWATVKWSGSACYYKYSVAFEILFVTIYFDNFARRLFITLAKQQMMNGTRWREKDDCRWRMKETEK